MPWVRYLDADIEVPGLVPAISPTYFFKLKQKKVRRSVKVIKLKSRIQLAQWIRCPEVDTEDLGSTPTTSNIG